MPKPTTYLKSFKAEAFGWASSRTGLSDWPQHLRRRASRSTLRLWFPYSIELDVEGAAAVGIPALLLDREERNAKHPERIGSLHELLDRFS